jgi:hypothetical protein
MAASALQFRIVANSVLDFNDAAARSHQIKLTLCRVAKPLQLFAAR